MANDTTDLLAAGLIHELRHPLMAIKLGLQLVQKSLGEDLNRQAEWPLVLGHLKQLEDLLASYQLLLSPEEKSATPRAARRILLVEDDVAIRTLVKRGLEGRGFHVVSAASAEEALMMIEAAAFEAVVTDKNLPGKSGVEVARAIRSKNRDAALVMMTGFSSRESAKEMQGLDADAYLTKPFDTADLATLIEQLVLRRLARNALRERLSSGEAPGVINRIVVIEPDPKDRARLARLIDDRKLTPLVRPYVIAALDETPAPHALVVDSGSLTDEARLRIASMQAQRPDFKVLLLSPADNTTEFLAGILLNASAQLFRPWTDEAFVNALRRSFESKEPLP